jgi:hypothetical protein
MKRVFFILLGVLGLSVLGIVIVVGVRPETVAEVARAESPIKNDIDQIREGVKKWEQVDIMKGRSPQKIYEEALDLYARGLSPEKAVATAEAIGKAQAEYDEITKLHPEGEAAGMGVGMVQVVVGVMGVAGVVMVIVIAIRQKRAPRIKDQVIENGQTPA